MKPVAAVAEYVGLTLSDTQFDKLRTYRDWLADEGARSGGIGPGEINRIETRHLADSLLFARGFPTEVREVVDLGTGLGLPGVPLAITLPGTEFMLIDRSQTRLDLLRRALRILDLDNCHTVQGEIESLGIRTGVVVTRASLPPPRLAPIVARLLTPGGVAIAGGSWRIRPQHDGWETVEIPSYLLDRPIWLLMMRRA